MVRLILILFFIRSALSATLSACLLVFIHRHNLYCTRILTVKQTNNDDDDDCEIMLES